MMAFGMNSRRNAPGGENEDDGMKIEVFGTGCPKCNMLETNVKRVLTDLGLKAEVVKITSIDEMVERGLMSTPALAIDGELVVAGRVPSVVELRGIFEARRRVD